MRMHRGTAPFYARSSAMACSKEAVLELKDVVLAVKEVTRWYEVGLQLGLPEEKLKLISAHHAGHRGAPANDAFKVAVVRPRG